MRKSVQECMYWRLCWICIASECRLGGCVEEIDLERRAWSGEGCTAVSSSGCESCVILVSCRV
jgi:hypothetical protein